MKNPLEQSPFFLPNSQNNKPDLSNYTDEQLQQIINNNPDIKAKYQQLLSKH